MVQWKRGWQIGRWKQNINTGSTPQTNSDWAELRLFGCVRVVWNDALALCKSADKLPNYNQLSALLTSTKKTESRVWLNEVSSVPLQQFLRHLATAYKNFFDSHSGKRKGVKLQRLSLRRRPKINQRSLLSRDFLLKELKFSWQK
jgi:transposase